MIRHVALLCLLLQTANFALVQSAKQQVQLSDSYLPVAMQVIAHLTDQMAFEAKDEPTPAKPTAKPTTKPQTWPKPTTTPQNWPKPTTKPTNTWPKPTTKPQSWPKPTTKPQSWPKPTTKPQSWPKPTNSWAKPVTASPYVINQFGFFPSGGWWRNSSVQLLSTDQTTPFHSPGIFSPVAPPKPSDRNLEKTGFVLLPIDHNSQYTVIEPQETRTDEALLSIHEEEVNPLIEPAKEEVMLPPHFDIDKSSRYDDESLTEENLQHLSPTVQEMIRMANDPNDERLIDVWGDVKGGSHEVYPKGKLSASNLRLLLLYDLLSREAKRLKLSDYSGFSQEVMRNLVESSSGGARAQLRMALSKMVDRKDCQHEYANNRAKEMVAELAKDETILSSELRYLQPLVYKL